jgi:hypothetical protein
MWEESLLIKNSSNVEGEEMEKKALVLIMGAAIGMLTILFPLPTQTQPEPISSPLNSELLATLAGAGIDATVDISGDRILIRYSLPRHMSKEAAQHYILFKASNLVPYSTKIIIQVQEGSEYIKEVTVNTEDYLAFAEKQITYAEFENTIEARSIRSVK